MSRTHVLLGVFTGILLAILGFVGCVLYVSRLPLSLFFEATTFLHLHDKTPVFLSIGSIPILIVFMIIVRLQKYNLAKGLLIATLLVALTIFILKLS